MKEVLVPVAGRDESESLVAHEPLDRSVHAWHFILRRCAESTALRPSVFGLRRCRRFAVTQFADERLDALAAKHFALSLLLKSCPVAVSSRHAGLSSRSHACEICAWTTTDLPERRSLSGTGGCGTRAPTDGQSWARRRAGRW